MQEPKRPRLATATTGAAFRFKSGEEIRGALKETDREKLATHLIELRNQLSLKPHEQHEDEILPPTDPRVLLVQSWLSTSPILDEIFSIWGSSFHASSSSILTPILSILASVLDLTRMHHPAHPLGVRVLKRIMEEREGWGRKLNSYLSTSGGGGGRAGGGKEVTLVTMRLWRALASWAKGAEGRVVAEAFNWDLKMIGKLLNMRRHSNTRGKSQGKEPEQDEISQDTLRRPDIRTHTLLFLLSFFTANISSVSSSLRTHLLTTYLPIYLMIFKSLPQDSYPVMRKVLKICWEGVWEDRKLSRSLKVALFGEQTLSNLVKLYERVEDENLAHVGRDEGEEGNEEKERWVPADLVHHFLLAICTRPGVGICFKDRGWYPRSDGDAEVARGEAEGSENWEVEGGKGQVGKGKIYNKVLLNLLRVLSPTLTTDPRQQELVLAIFKACPELVAAYWQAGGAGGAMEPRLSSRWLANLTFWGEVVSLPVPSSSFPLSADKKEAKEQQTWNHTPPPLSAILENIAPGGTVMKAHLTKGLQNTSGLVRHVSALALARCLTKLGKVAEAMKEVGEALGEGEDELLGWGEASEGESGGMWARRRNELEREIRRRVPEWAVVLGFAQRLHPTSSSSAPPSDSAHAVKATEKVEEEKEEKPGEERNEAKYMLLEESGQRLLWLYRKWMPGVVEEARWESGKLLSLLADGDDGESDEEELGEESEEDIASSREGSEEVEGDGDGGMEEDGEEEDGDEGDDEIEATLEDDSSLQPSLRPLTHLHLLRLVTETSSSFSLFSKTSTTATSQTNLRTLLHAYTTTPSRSIRSALATLLTRTLASTVLFQHDEEEVGLWLGALPRSKRAKGTEGPDGARLDDERKGVVRFLDECVQRCNKTPYRYLEHMQHLAKSATEDMDMSKQEDQEAISNPATFPSPILATVIEQLSAKLTAKLLSPSDVLAITTYVRKMIFKLSMKQRELGLLSGVVAGLEVMLGRHSLLFEGELPNLSAAIRKEVECAERGLDHNHRELGDVMVGDESVDEFLEAVEDMPTSSISATREKFVVEFIDWVRLLDTPLQAKQVQRLLAIVERYDPARLTDIVSFLVPGRDHVWSALASMENLPAARRLDFDWLFMHAREQDLAIQSSREYLIAALFQRFNSVRVVTGGIALISHSMMALQRTAAALADLVSLMQSIFQSARVSLSTKDHSLVKETFFVESDCLSVLSSSTSSMVRDTLGNFLSTALDCTSSKDCSLVASQVQSWWNAFRANQRYDELDLVSSAKLWSPFMPLDMMSEYLTHLASQHDLSDRPISFEVTTTVLNALSKKLQLSGSVVDIAQLLSGHVSTLSKLRFLPVGSSTVDDLLRMACQTTVPLGIGGLLNEQEARTLHTVLGLSTESWGRRPLDDFALQDSISSDAIAEVVYSMLYSGALQDEKVVLWLSEADSSQTSAEHLSLILHAFCDVLNSSRQICSSVCSDAIFSHALRLCSVLGDSSSTAWAKMLVVDALASLMPLMSTAQQNQLFDRLLVLLGSAGVNTEPYYYIRLASLLSRSQSDNARSFGASVVDHALQWAVRYISRDAVIGVEERSLHSLGSLLKVMGSVKPHLADPLLGTIIQYRLNHDICLELARTLVTGGSMKPLLVNRHLQSIVQNPSFGRLAWSSHRVAIIDLLSALFRAHPSNTSQPSHIEPLIHIYGATLSGADRKLLSIFELFEQQRKLSVGALFDRWSPSRGATFSTPLESLSSVDPTMLLHTAVRFPAKRRLQGDNNDSDDTFDRQIYDPVFILFQFARVLSNTPPTSMSNWVGLFRSNVVCVVVRCLSSQDADVRAVALAQLGHLRVLLESADMQEQPEVLHVMHQLKNALSPSPDDTPPRLPSYITLMLLHALRGIFYPANFVYPLTARFLLQRPEVDTGDVPLLYSMLYTNGELWKKERTWIIRFLADGMVSSEDWRVFKRRHTWDLLASLFQSSKGNTSLRLGILEVLANLSCCSSAIMSLILKSRILTWIEMNLHECHPQECLPWIRIFDNILIVVHKEKLERAFDDAWRSQIARCLERLLKISTSSQVLLVAAPLILRLSLLPGRSLQGMHSLLAIALDILRRQEPSIRTAEVSYVFPTPKLEPAPYRAEHIHTPVPEVDPLAAWGSIVQQLWRASMTTQEVCSSWAPLTSRLIWWRAQVGEETSPVGEWARREAILCMRSQPMA